VKDFVDAESCWRTPAQWGVPTKEAALAAFLVLTLLVIPFTDDNMVQNVCELHQDITASP